VAQSNFSDLDSGPAVTDSDVNNYELTIEDIKYIRASFVESLETSTGRTPLQCENLDDPPSINDIEDYFCSVVGDVFHAMDRAKVPTKHEAKKGYFVALCDAFFEWDQDTLNDLKRRMSADGKTDKEINNAKYFDAGLFSGCISRRVPPPSTLYWRVGAVFALYGKITDTKKNKPLFNKLVWRKAN
jgi:hypothetical protein